MCYDLDVKNFEIACSGLPSKNGDKILLARRIYYLLVSLILGLLEKLECNFDLKGDHRSTRKGLFSLIGIRQKTTNH